DRRLSGLADSLGLHYSRYADDLAFSSPAHRSRREVAHFLDLVGTITAKEGFRINAMKTTVRRRGERQRLAGILVNERLNVDRRHYEDLKALLHNAQMNGPQSQNRADQPHFADHVRGRIAWVDHLNPNRGRRLLDSFNQSNWTEP
ncbi:MAG: Retron-type RNA-directed polymerase, partial [Acidimicrobiaceae bacterium]|nr:Retron-type RNA-directed polymerase [Acidimicrobiaceae bacterium]